MACIINIIHLFFFILGLLIKGKRAKERHFFFILWLLDRPRHSWSRLRYSKLYCFCFHFLFWFKPNIAFIALSKAFVIIALLDAFTIVSIYGNVSLRFSEETKISWPIVMLKAKLFEIIIIILVILGMSRVQIDILWNLRLASLILVFHRVNIICIFLTNSIILFPDNRFSLFHITATRRPMECFLVPLYSFFGSKLTIFLIVRFWMVFVVNAFWLVVISWILVIEIGVAGRALILAILVLGSPSFISLPNHLNLLAVWIIAIRNPIIRFIRLLFPIHLSPSLILHLFHIILTFLIIPIITMILFYGLVILYIVLLIFLRHIVVIH